MRKPSWMSAIMARLGAVLRRSLVATIVVASLGDTFAGENTSLPFEDTFEAYTNLTPLIDGVNGWYGSASNIIVISNMTIGATGTNSAMIPEDCTLSNRFQNMAITNIWLRMDVRPVLYDGTNYHIVDTNQAVLFYVNSNGNFVVHNGPAYNPFNSTNWVVTTNGGVGTNASTWVQINILENFAQTNWDLYANGVLVTNAIGFINTNLTNFAGFDIYNGYQTTYLDNVSVTAMATNQHPLIVLPSVLSAVAFVGKTPPMQTVQVINVWSDNIGFQVMTNQSWLSASLANGTVTAKTMTNMTLTYASTTTWPVGAISNALVTIVATNGSGSAWGTQTVDVVMNIMRMDVTPTNITNTTMAGYPTTRTFDIINAGAGSFQYTVGITDVWLSCSSTSGSASAFSTNRLTLTFPNTAGGTSTTTVTIASADGGGAKQELVVTMNVMDLQVNPTILVNEVMLGGTPADQSLTVTNAGVGTFDFTVTNTAWLSETSTNGTLGPHSAVVIPVKYASTAGWIAGTSNGTIRVASTNGGGKTQDVAVTLRVMELQVTPANLTNEVWIGDTPVSQTFEVRNVGAVSMDWTVAVANPEWVSCSPVSGVLGDGESSTVTLTYSNTAGWAAGQSNTTLIVATTTGGGASKTVDVTLNVVAFDTGALQVAPSALTNMVAAGETPASRTFNVMNSGTVSLAYTVEITTGTWLNCSSSSGSVEPNGTNTLTLGFVNTTDWPAGSDSNTTVTVTTLSGGGAMKTVVVTLHVLDTGVLNVIPYADNFEAYSDQMPLVGGVSGWYGSASSVLVQEEIKASGTKAAMMPVDCMLSNRFQSCNPTNVWVQMDVRPSLFDGMHNPTVDTNTVWMFYVNSNGNFVVHNGPATDAEFSTNWVETTNGCLGPSGTNWVGVQVRINYANQTWALFTTNNRTMVTNNIGFINPNITNFTEFELYSGQSTSYIDNVLVTMPVPTNYYLQVTPTIVTNFVMLGHTTNITLNIGNQSDINDMYWIASSTDTWIQMGTTNGTVVVGDATNLVVTNSAVNLAAGTYTGHVVVTATVTDPFFSPESVVVTSVLQVMELQIAPSATNAVVMQGEWTNNSFEIWNAGGGILYYTATANQSWLMLSQSSGILTGQTADATNTIVVTYTNTSGLTVGDHYGTITIASTTGGGATNTLAVTLNVRAAPMLNVSPALITKTVMAGQNLDDQTLLVWNESAYYGILYNVATNAPWLTVPVTNNYLAPLAMNAMTIHYAVNTLTPAGDVPSNYLGAITITATTDTASSLPASGSPVTIPVAVQVNPKPRLACSPTNLFQTILQGKDAASQGFDVWNANGYYTLNYAIKSDTPWLVLTSAGGTSTGQHQRIEVQYSTANLPAGNTNALITVVGRAWDGVHEDSALDATQTIVVALSVTPFATLTTDAQSGYSYRVCKGVTPPDTVFSVWNGGTPPNAMNFTVSPSVSWLRVTPLSGSSTGDKVEVRVQADATGMKPLVVYKGTVQIEATDANSGKTAYGSPKSFTIEVVSREFNGFNFQGGTSGASDLVVYRESSGNWAITNLMSKYATNLFFGGAGYKAVPGDYSGDGITDFGIYRPASGSWYAWQVGAESVYVVEMQQWAGAEYVGVPGDYDGDGRVGPGVYLEKSGLWMLLVSGSGYQQASAIFGGPGYAALQAGDYDGDGRVDPGVYHRVSGLWMLLLSGTGYAMVSGTFGGSGFVPVPTDYDGDGITDPAIYETSTGRWYILRSTTLTSQGYGFWNCQFGGVAMSATLVPAPGDYDGDGCAELGLYDTTMGYWYISTIGGELLAWGSPLGGFGYRPILP